MCWKINGILNYSFPLPRRKVIKIVSIYIFFYQSKNDSCIEIISGSYRAYSIDTEYWIWLCEVLGKECYFVVGIGMNECVAVGTDICCCVVGECGVYRCIIIRICFEIDCSTIPWGVVGECGVYPCTNIRIWIEIDCSTIIFLGSLPAEQTFRKLKGCSIN